jgi:hypothetical protein
MSERWEVGQRHADHPFRRGNDATLATQVADHIGGYRTPIPKADGDEPSQVLRLRAHAVVF